MNAWKHSVSSANSFGGRAEDYLQIHRWIDFSKLFIYDAKHRCLLHHTFGMEICEQLHGDTIALESGKQVPVREIAAQHFREDLSKRVPTLHDWFGDAEDQLGAIIHLPEGLDEDLESFVMKPYLRCGLKSSLMITYSHFGVALAEQIHGYRFARRLAETLPPHHRMSILMGNFKLTQRWQSTIDHASLTRINDLVKLENKHG